MSGPFHTQADARAVPEVRAVYALPPGTGQWQRANLDMLTDALDAAGVELGAYDERIVAWLSRWEPEAVAVVASWVTRAAGPRCQRCGGTAPEGNDFCRECEERNGAEALAALRAACERKDDCDAVRDGYGCILGAAPHESHEARDPATAELFLRWKS